MEYVSASSSSYIYIANAGMRGCSRRMGRSAKGGGGGTHAWEFDTAVTAFGGAAALLDVLVLELSAGGFDDADFVGAGVVSVYHHEWSAVAAHLWRILRRKGLSMVVMSWGSYGFLRRCCGDGVSWCSFGE